MRLEASVILDISVLFIHPGVCVYDVTGQFSLVKYQPELWLVKATCFKHGQPPSPSCGANPPLNPAGGATFVNSERPTIRFWRVQACSRQKMATVSDFAKELPSLLIKNSINFFRNEKIMTLMRYYCSSRDRTDLSLWRHWFCIRC